MPSRATASGCCGWPNGRGARSRPRCSGCRPASPTAAIARRAVLSQRAGARFCAGARRAGPRCACRREHRPGRAAQPGICRWHASARRRMRIVRRRRARRSRLPASRRPRRPSAWQSRLGREACSSIHFSWNMSRASRCLLLCMGLFCGFLVSPCSSRRAVAVSLGSDSGYQSCKHPDARAGP